MGVTECSMCRRPAAWLIDTEVFCEGHKELIIEAADVDQFRIQRLMQADFAYQSGRRTSRTVAAKKGSTESGWRVCSVADLTCVELLPAAGRPPVRAFGLSRDPTEVISAYGNAPSH
jgi:hypothetical protein